MINETSQKAVASGRATGKTGSADSLLRSQHQREIERAEWKRRQALQPSYGTLLAPSLPDRIGRLNPRERHELQSLIKSMKLRKIVKRILAEAFWKGEQQKALDELRLDEWATMRRLRDTVHSRESTTSYEGALMHFEPSYTRSTYGEGNDAPAVTRALERSLIQQP